MKVRVDTKLRALIQAEAAQEGVSMNAVIAARLTASYARQAGLSDFGHDLLVLALQTELDAKAR